MVDPVEIGMLALGFLVVAAFLAGLIDSMSGGGGLISLPATLLVGVPPHLALGSNKFMAAMGTTASFFTYARNHAVVWRIAALGVPFSLMGSVMGTRTALILDSAVLGKVLLVLLPVAALLTFMPIRRSDARENVSSKLVYCLTPVFCAAIGFYDGFFGPGTGSFMLLALHLGLGLGLVASSGTAKAFNLASNVSSLTVFLLNDKVFYIVAIPMALANIVGNVMGSRLALRRGPQLIRRMLLFSLGLLFVSLVWTYVNAE